MPSQPLHQDDTHFVIIYYFFSTSGSATDPPQPKKGPSTNTPAPKDRTSTPRKALKMASKVTEMQHFTPRVFSLGALTTKCYTYSFVQRFGCCEVKSKSVSQSVSASMKRQRMRNEQVSTNDVLTAVMPTAIRTSSFS